MRAAVLAAAFALCACSQEYTSGDAGSLPDSGPPLISPNPDAGDAGPDGGDAGPDGGDAGPDAGCAALTLSGVPAFDGCAGNLSATATGTVNTTNCTLTLSLSTSSGPCAGTVSGANNAFDGGCFGGATYTCTSVSMPGILNCTFNGGICSIKICDAGATCP